MYIFNGVDNWMNHAYAVFNIEANVFCLCGLLVLEYKTATGADRPDRKGIFSFVLLITILNFLANILWELEDAALLPRSGGMMYLATILYVSLVSLNAYSIFWCMEILQNAVTVRSRRLHVLTAIPWMVNVGLLFSTPFTHVFYYIGPGTELLPGKHYELMIAIDGAYIVAAGILAVIRLVKNRYYKQRSAHIAALFFSLQVFSSGILQTVYWRVPILCYGLTGALFCIYLIFMEDLIALDPLTGVNNRKQMEIYLKHKLDSAVSRKKLYLIIMDIDRFKEINDTFGHETGDRVLIQFVKTVQDLCDRRRKINNETFLLSRYGGDEFVVIAEIEERTELERFLDELRDALRELSVDGADLCGIQMSTGYVCAMEKELELSVAGLFRAADRRLYSEKQEHHQTIPELLAE